MSLRARLLLVLAVLAVAGIVAADVATYVSLRTSLTDRVDRTVAAGASVLARGGEHRGFLDGSALTQLAATSPGVYIGLIETDGSTTFQPFGTKPGEEPPPKPKLPDTLPRTIFTTHAVSGSTRFRTQAEPLDSGQILVVAAPLTEVDDTLHRLFLIELIVSLAVVGGIVATGAWLIRVGLRPLRRIEATAGAIAAGDLSRRIDDAGPRTEVGRLGSALNAMLAQIERAFSEREASENRLRQFVADASHELRTPLSSVHAYAELFERGARDRPEDLERAMRGIARESRRMGVLIDDLLLLARLDQGRPLERKPVDLAEIARDAVDAARAVEPGRPIALDAPAPAPVTGDPTRLRQVVDNLLANARAHTPPDTAVTVSARTVNGTALLEVADRGPGLSPEQAGHVFDRFYRADPSRSRDAGGTGLGLAIVDSIAHAHGGEARVESAPGQGATFTVAIPVARADAADTAGSADSREGHSPLTAQPKA